jgi:hypothetical protein
LRIGTGAEEHLIDLPSGGFANRNAEIFAPRRPIAGFGMAETHGCASRDEPSPPICLHQSIRVRSA